MDCGRHEAGQGKKDDDDWWLDLYVMLSRATRSEDILVMRAPPVEFLLRGPPSGLREQLRAFLKKAVACRRQARKVAHDLGFDAFLHEDADPDPLPR